MFSQNNDNLDEYKFEGNVKALVKEMAEAKSKGQLTEAIRVELLRNELGQALLGRVNNILIIDSALTAYNQLSELYKDFTVTIQTNNNRLSSVYENNSRTRRVLPMADEKGLTKMAESVRIGSDAWSRPVILPEFEHESEQVNFPYLSADGRTMYYSVQNEHTLGGYDILVSCFDETTGKFSKGVNLGLPFNSPWNDFLFVWDETLRYGKFATDRNTPKGYVRVYTFVVGDSIKFLQDVDNESRKVFASTCQLKSDSLSNDHASQHLNDLRQAIKQKTSDRATVNTSGRIVITDDVVCSNDSELKSPNARRIAADLRKQEAMLIDKARILEEKRKAFHNARSDQLRKEILSLENEVDKLETTIATMLINIRQAEIKI
ncbi:MAG: hypothetical protein IJM84_02065 [Bacteroidaceae bacterium]|nr:hypothetical protein [Bacteroidaceae bacterium]